MRLLDHRTFAGPNLYARFPVVRMTIDLEALEERPTSSIEGFTDRILAAVPSLGEHKCCFGWAGGFVRRLEEGTWMGHVIEHTAIALQNLVDQNVSFGKTRSTGERGHYRVVFACRDLGVGTTAGNAALELVEALLPPDLRSGTPRAPAEIIAAFVHETRERALGPSTSALVRAAERRGIPWRRIGHGALVELGFGRHRRRVWGTITSNTGSVAVEISCDKARTRDLLDEAGIPTPRQRVVDDAESARLAVADLGLPAVLKPIDGNHGRGVTFVHSLDAVPDAFDTARRAGRRVVVETYVPGDDHRLLVVGGRFVAGARRDPGLVQGDGEHTIADLVVRQNADPRRGDGHAAALTFIELDDEATRCLRDAGLTEKSVPALGQTVFLRRTANLSRGGTATDVTDRVHPDVRRIAERAARAIGLDVAGIDYLTPDISAPPTLVPGAVCEVNASPGLRMHHEPTVGAPREVAESIIEQLYPANAPVTIPIAAVTGTNGKTTTARMLAHVMGSRGVVGLATTDGVYIDGRLVQRGDLTGPVGARMVLGDPRVDVAVLEVARGGLLRAGLGVPYVDVGAVTNVAADHIGLDGVRDVDEMASVKRIVVEVARDLAVLNGDDPRVRAMARHTRAQARCFVTESRDPAAIRALRNQADAVIAIQTRSSGDLIVRHESFGVCPVVPVARVPATLGGVVRHNVANAMFAVAMAWGSGVDDERIAAALATFTNDFETLPGRFNVYRGLPFNVVLDYGHNAAGFERVVEAVDGLQTTGRRIVVVGLAGDRRDDDVRAAARVLAPAFDHFVCRGESDLRGRAPGELPRVMARSLVEAGVAPHDVIQVDDELEATRVALHVAVPGDLVIVFGVQLENTWGLIRGFVPTATEHRPDLLVRRSRERAPAAQGRARWGVAPPEPGTRTEP